MMSFKFRQRIKLAPGLFLNLDKGLPSISIDGKGCSPPIGKRSMRATTDIPGTGLSYSTETVKYAGQISPSLSSQTTHSPAQTPSALPGPNTSQIKLIWTWAIAILGGVSGFWLISSRPSNQVESDRAILAETRPTSAPTMTPEEGTKQSRPVLEVRRAELVISPQVRRAELVTPTATKKTHREGKEN
jgi:hypothetical protein